MPAARTIAAYTVIDALARLAKTSDDDRGMDELRADALFDLIADAHDQLTGRTPRAVGLTDDAPGGQPQRSNRLYSVQVTVPAETLTGESEAPGELAGYGPITSQAARELAADDATWQRILYDPATGKLLHVGRNRYRPPTRLAEHVLARDRTCRHPGCRQPAHRCDLDHCRRYPDGPTAKTNLNAVCRFHHRLKHHTKWESAMDSAGVTTWTSIAGRVYVTYPWDYRPGGWLTEPPAERVTEADIDSTVDYELQEETKLASPTAA